MTKPGKTKRMRTAILVVLLAVVLACLPMAAFAVGENQGRPSESTASEGQVSAAADDDGKDAAKEVEGAAGEPADDDAGKTGDAAADSSGESAEEDPESEVDQALEEGVALDDTRLEPIDSDSAGTVFTFDTPLDGVAFGGDLFWAGDNLELHESHAGNDVLTVGRKVLFADSNIDSDVRVGGQTVTFSHVVAQGNVNVAAVHILIDKQSAATGYYCAGGTISYEGKSKRFIGYGQTIYFNGMVDGDVTLSAQDIVIGPRAVVTGTLDVRSGQTLEALSVPQSAQIGRIDTTLNQPNTIDQIAQIRATIAPYFQVGSLLFVIVSFALLALAMYWGFGHKMTEANRLIRKYPLAVVVLACIALMLMFVAVTLGALLVFTIPFAAVVLLVFLVSAICCVPFTGASLMLMMRNRIRPVLCVALGSAIGSALLFVPYINVVVFAGSLIYFIGYVINIAMFGHDGQHDGWFREREADQDAPHGKASGILPTGGKTEPPPSAAAQDQALAEAAQEGE